MLDFLDKASGALTVAKVEFGAERKKADAKDQPEFDAAVATCDAITRSLDERQKVIGDINASRAVKGSGKLQDGPRRDYLGPIEAKREKDVHKGAVKSAGQADDALTAMSLNRWNKRSIELRKYITDAYAKTK